MQPNQQDPNILTQPPQPTPARLDPYGRPLPPSQYQPTQPSVPEYLHMEPVADPMVKINKRKKRGKIVLIILASLLVIMAIGVLVFWISQQNVPQYKFYGVLEKQMQVKYLSEKIAFSGGSSGSYTIESTSDFSDLATTKSQTAVVLNDPKSTPIIKLEEISLKSNEYFGQVTQANDRYATKLKNAQLTSNQWYKLHTTNSKKDALSKMFNLPASTRNWSGFVINGNLSVAERSQTIDSIKNNSIYNIKASHSEKLDGSQMTVYESTINTDKLHKLSTILPGFTSKKIDSEMSLGVDSNTKFTIWVNDASGLIQKITFKLKADANNAVPSGEVSFDYPPSVTINEPNDIKNLDI
jgi:hypothetical protein